MNEYHLTYIDDEFDPYISEYLGNFCNDKNVIYKEVKFKPVEGYESLINNADVKRSNFILIDSRLYENNSVEKRKFTGEELKILFKKYFPFIEVVVISQNNDRDEYGTILKYQFGNNESSNDYYDKYLKKLIEEAIDNNKKYEKIIEEFSKNENWKNEIKQSIKENMNGFGEIDNLSSEDIDRLIEKFNEIEKIINENRL